MPRSTPTGIRIIGENWFHDGWISGILGLPPREFFDADNPVLDVDIDSWREGYAMGMETQNDLRPVFQKMLTMKQLTIM